MTDIVFAVPVFDHVPASELRMLRSIADMAEEMCANLAGLFGDEWQEADVRIADIQDDLIPLLAEYRQHYPVRSADDPAPLPRRDPFDADARTIAGITPDDPDTYPIIAFL